MKRFFVAVLAVLAIATAAQAERDVVGEYVGRACRRPFEQGPVKKSFEDRAREVYSQQQQAQYMAELLAQRLGNIEAAATRIDKGGIGRSIKYSWQTAVFASQRLFENMTSIDRARLVLLLGSPSFEELLKQGKKTEAMMALFMVAGNYDKLNESTIWMIELKFYGNDSFDRPVQYNKFFTALLRGDETTALHVLRSNDDLLPVFESVCKQHVPEQSEFFQTLEQNASAERQELLAAGSTAKAQGEEDKPAKKTAAELRAEAAKLLEQAEAAEGKPTTKKTKKAKKTQGVN